METNTSFVIATGAWRSKKSSFSTRPLETAMKHLDGARFLGPDALALLQECFDKLIERNDLSRNSEDANLIAATLFQAYDRGITDKADLMRLADLSPALKRTG